MGVDTRFIIGEVTTSCPDEKERPWLNVVAEFEAGNLGGCTELHGLGTSGKHPEIYFFGIDGNNPVTEDKYGDKMLAVPIKEFLTALRKEIEATKEDHGGKPYRRLSWLLPLITRMKNDRPLKNLCVVMYNH